MADQVFFAHAEMVVGMLTTMLTRLAVQLDRHCANSTVQYGEAKIMAMTPIARVSRTKDHLAGGEQSL